MLRLSFIVPFYNVEPYIEECIRSLYNQDIPQEEYEVICVDDCSPDGSRAIVERLQKEYPTLKLLIHTENKRQGGARNTGMKVAQGIYIWFMDSDDYIKPNCLKDLLERAEREARKNIPPSVLRDAIANVSFRLLDENGNEKSAYDQPLRSFNARYIQARIEFNPWKDKDTDFKIQLKVTKPDGNPIYLKSPQKVISLFKNQRKIR